MRWQPPADDTLPGFRNPAIAGVVPPPANKPVAPSPVAPSPVAPRPAAPSPVAPSPAVPRPAAQAPLPPRPEPLHPHAPAPVSAPAYAPPAAPVPPPPAFEPPAPSIFAAAPAPVFAAAAVEKPEFTPAPAFTPSPSYATAETYAAAPEAAPASPADEPFVPHAEAARTIEEERARQFEDGTRDAYAPLDDTISRAWPPLAQSPELGGVTAEPAHAAPATAAPAAAAPYADTYPAPADEEPARSVTGAPLPQFLIPDSPTEPPAPANPPSQLPATADRFAELVYAARNKSIEFEPDALRERPPNRAPLLALVLASIVVAVSLLQYRSIEAFIPVTTGIFKAVGLR